MNETESTDRRQHPPLHGRLNSFQLTMLDWNEVHPYNAVHVLKFPEPPDLARLAQAVRQTLVFHGLDGLRLDRKNGTFRYAENPSPLEIPVLPMTDAPDETLRAEIERQVNTGFDFTGNFRPFRFFVVPQKESFHFGLVYFHAVADAVSIVQLLRQIYVAYLGRPAEGNPPPFQLAEPGTSAGATGIIRKLKVFLGQLGQHRRSVRVAHRNIFDGGNRFEQLTLGPEMLRDLATAAKTWDVTINDLFLSALLLVCSPFTLNRFHEPPRGRISIGCIVNTRADLGLADPQAWGLFLGSFVVTHAVPEGISLRQLATDIRRQTAAIKRRKDYAGPALELVLGRFLLSFFSTPYRTKLYQKHYPLWGGVTNMNLNSLWPPPADATPVDYFRGVSTGPVTPLVLSATTVGDVVNLGLTFRSTTFTEANIRQVKKHLLEIFRQLKPPA